MPPLGVFQLSVILLAVAAQSRVRADSGSFGDSGFYKIVIEKTRVPALEDGIPHPDANEANQGASVIMHNKKGQPFRCSIPQMARVPDEKDKLVNLTTQSIEEALVPTESNRGCVNLVTSGWWHYEFCFRKHVTQYHMDSGGAISKPVIILGLFSSAFDWSNVSLKDALRKRDRYHMQYFTNGSECDITGQQRQTRVKIYCDNSHWTTDHIESVREPESCVYEVIIFSKRLCSIPYFKKEEPVVSQIQCNPVNSRVTTLSRTHQTPISSVQNQPKSGNIWMESFSTEKEPEKVVPTELERHQSEPEKSAVAEERLPDPKKDLPEEINEDDDANLFYKKARKLAVARKEKWIAEDVLNHAYSIVLEDERNPFVQPSNREFIVRELVRRTAHLLIHKAKLNSAEQRSLAFDQAAENVGDAKRILNQKDHLTEVFIARYTPVVALLQQYVEQFLSLYDLETMSVVPELAEEEELNMEFREELRKQTEETPSQTVIPINQAQVSSMMKKIDILSLKPFSAEEREVFDALVDSGKAILLISKTFDDKDDESNEAAIRDAENELLAIKQILNNPKSRTWRPEFRDKMNQILSLKLAMLTDLYESMADTPYDTSEESVEANVVDTKASSASESSAEVLSAMTSLRNFEADFYEMERFYSAEGYPSSTSVSPQQATNSKSDTKMSEDEMEATKKILFSHTTAIRLTLRDENVEENYQRSRILMDEAVFMLSDEKRNIREELKTKLQRHLERIGKYLDTWKHARNMEMVKASLDGGPLNEQQKKATLETLAPDNDELTADEKDVVIALFKSYTYANNITPGKGDPVVRTEAFKNCRLLAERARWLLRDQSKKIRPPFREKMSVRVEKLADHLERLEKADAQLQKLRMELKEVGQLNSELNVANKLLQDHNLDFNKWTDRFSGTIEKARDSVLKDLKVSSASAALLRPLAPTDKRKRSASQIPPPTSKALHFRDVIANFDPKERRLKEIEEILREKLVAFGGGGGLQIKLVNPDQQRALSGLAERQLELIKRDLAGLFAAQMLGVNKQQRVVDELEENYNLQEEKVEEHASLSERQRILNPILDL